MAKTVEEAKKRAVSEAARKHSLKQGNYYFSRNSTWSIQTFPGRLSRCRCS